MEWDAQEPIVKNNGVAIFADNSRALLTTESGKLLQAPISSNEGVSTLWDPPSVGNNNNNIVCQSKVILYQERYAVYAVRDEDNNDVSSRVFIVDTQGFEATRTIDVEGSISGTPIVSDRTGHLFVVHLVRQGPNNAGKLSIYNLANVDELVVTVPEGDAAKDVKDLTAPTMTTVTLDSGKVVDWIVIGESQNEGFSDKGSLYGIRFDPSSGEALWHLLARDIGSLIAPPAVSTDGRSIVAGSFRNFVLGWINVESLGTALNSDSELVLDLNPTWSDRISRRDSPPTTQPVMVESLGRVLTTDIFQDLYALDMNDGGATRWVADSFFPHSASPIVFEKNGDVIVYDIEEAGVLRQVNAVTGQVNYRANCRGLIRNNINNPLLFTRNNCESVLAQFALSPNGDFVVYASEDGIISVMRVGDFGTEAPTVTPSVAPSASPSASPSAAPSKEPTSPPSTTEPTGSPTESPTRAPTLTLYPSVAPTTSPTLAPVTSLPTKLPEQAVFTARPVPPIPIGDDDDDDDDDDDSGSDGGAGSDDDDDDDDDDSGGGTQVDGLGNGVPSGDSDSSLGSIIIILAVLAVLLCCCVVGLCYFMKQRKSEDIAEEKQIQSEVAVKKAWMSNKMIYEEEMRMEEEETLNALNAAAADGDTPPEATAAAQILQAKTLRTNRRRRQNRHRITSIGSLGSISESECEADDYAIESDMGESGFEIALELMEKGSELGETDGSSPTSSSKSSPSNSPPRDSDTGTRSSMDNSAIVGDFMPSTLAAKTLAHPSSMSSSVTADPIIEPRSTAAPSPNHQRWFMEVLSVRANALQEGNKKSSVSTPVVIPDVSPHEEETPQISNIQRQDTLPKEDEPEEVMSQQSSLYDEPGRIRVSMASRGNRQTLDDNPGTRTPTRNRSDSGDIPLRGANRGSPTGTPSDGLHVRPPESPMSPSDVLSVDSSLYLEGSTLSPHTLSPPGGASQLSSLHGGVAAPAGGRHLSPPGGGSILSGGASTRSPAVDEEADEFFKKPYSTPGSHYLMPPRLTPEDQPRVSGRSVGTGNPSPTSFHRPRMIAEEYEELDSPRGATTFGTRASPVGMSQSRAGLFSRRERPVERLLPQYESDASASDAESVDRQQQVEKQPSMLQSQWKPKHPQEPRPIPRTPDRGEKTGSMKDSGSVGNDCRSDSSFSNSKKNSPDRDSSKNMWNSFLTELTKAEEQFFNPATGEKMSGSSRGRKNRRSSAALESARSNVASARVRVRDHSPDEPPPPPMDDEIPPPPPLPQSMGYNNRSTSSNFADTDDGDEASNSDSDDDDFLGGGILGSRK